MNQDGNPVKKKTNCGNRRQKNKENDQKEERKYRIMEDMNL